MAYNDLCNSVAIHNSLSRGFLTFKTFKIYATALMHPMSHDIGNTQKTFVYFFMTDECFLECYFI